jgi:hypothetical protein
MNLPNKVAMGLGLMSNGAFDIHNVRCRVYYLIEKNKIIGYKWDTLNKHQGHKIDHCSLGFA